MIDEQDCIIFYSLGHKIYQIIYVTYNNMSYVQYMKFATLTG